MTPQGTEARPVEEQNWTELLERDYPDEASRKLIDGWRAEGKSDREIYQILEAFW